MDKLTRTPDKQAVNNTKKAAEVTKADEALVLTENQDRSAELATTPDADAEADDVLKEKPKYDSYDDFAEVAEKHLTEGHALKNKLQKLNERHNGLLSHDKLDESQEKALTILMQEYDAIKEESAEILQKTEDLIGTGFDDEDVDADYDDRQWYASLSNLRGSLIREMNNNAESKSTELSLDNLTTAHEFLLEKKGKLGDLLSNINELFTDTPSVGNLSGEFVLATISNQLFKEFDENYSEVLKKNGEIAPGNRDLQEDPSINQIYSLILETQKDIRRLRAKKDIVYIQISELGGIVTSKTNEEVIQEIDDLVGNESITSEEAEHLKTRFQQVQEYADMGLDGFIELNKGSSLDTFLSFLIDPVNARGKSGESLQFGKTDVGEGLGEAEIVPLHLFRALFTDSKRVGGVLKDVINKVDSNFRSSNGELFDALEKGENPEKTKEALLLIFNKLLTNNQNEEDNRKKFRAYFATELMGKEELQYMDGKSFLFLVENLKDGGTQLDSLWGLDG